MTRYLNNNGSRWIDTDRGAMAFVLVLPDGTRKPMTARYFEAFGNFACIVYRYKGKQYKALPKSEFGSDTRLDGEDPRPFVFHKP